MPIRTFIKIGFLLLIFFGGDVAAQDNQLDAKGLKHGPWKGYFEESKRVKYEGTFEHGVEKGVFTFYDDTKAHTVVATRDFSKGNGAAYTIFYDPQKNVVSEGNVINKKLEGPWKYYHKSSKNIMTLEHYKNGKLDGKRTVYYPIGTIAEETMYKNGVKNGPYKKYTEKGIVLEAATFKNNVFEGPAVYRDPKGTIVSKGNYKNGGKHGYWEFYEDGKLKSREKFPVSSRPRVKKDQVAKE